MGLGETDPRFRVACAGRGVGCGIFRDATAVLVEDVRGNGGATRVSTYLNGHDGTALPGTLLDVEGTPASFLGAGESFRDDRAD